MLRVLDNGRPSGYQLFSGTSYHYLEEGKPTRHGLYRRYKKKLKHKFHDYLEVFKDENYIIAAHEFLPYRFVETIDGSNWRFVPSWKGMFEVPKCIHTLQLELLSTIPAEAQ